MLRRSFTPGLATLWISTLYLFAIAGSPLTADDTEAPKFGKTYPSDAIRFVTATSEDRAVTTMLFDNFVLATETGRGQVVEAKTRTLTFGNVIEAKSDVSVNLDLRGFVSTVANGSAALIVMAGGETTAVDLQKAIESKKAIEEADPVRKSAAERATAAGFTVSAQPKGSDDFYARVPVRVAEGQPLQVTVVLIVDRQPTADSQALITIDSIDLAVKAVAKSDKAEKKSAKTEKATEKATDKADSKETKEAKAEKKTEAREASAKKEQPSRKEAAEKDSEKAAAKAEKADKPAKAESAKADSAKE